ncbi:MULTISPECIES: LysR family transcriptional regulator [Paenibacillus]|uniref:LysR family transcriptional regulator n=1 Tax=Paenibacillus TaxID=44249 RepID=UPI0022B88B06|nr:LysR family transcriptional regulator [Paenibacillus caseinilyticus]MCZ8521563.1 LysR family transcriptional regulator [Paenibacillus caseinilyticus]
MIANMEWYRVFYTVARTGSLSKAAQELYITQPAVSHSIKQLEKELGGQLFFRSSKGVRLTGEGEVLHSYIEQAYHLMEAGERRIGEIHGLEAGEVHIGAGDTLCRHVLLPRLESFREAYPAVKVSVTNRTTAETVALLKEGRIDFGVVHLPVQDPQLDVQPCLRIQDCFAAGRRYAALADPAAPLTLESLLGYPLILLEQGTSTRQHLDRYAAAQGLTLQPELELGSMDLLLQFARIGMGIACVVREFAQEEMQREGLVELPLAVPIPPREVGLVTLQGVPLSAAAREFMAGLTPM